MMKRQSTVGLGTLLLCFCLLACLEEGSENPGGLHSGIDQTKPADEMTQEDLLSLCEALQNYGQSKFTDKIACNLAGVLAADAALAFEQDPVIACRAALQDCDPAEVRDEVTTDDCDDLERPMNCSNTVGEVEDCLVSISDKQYEILSDLPECEQVEEWLASTDNTIEVEELPLCRDLDEGCF